MSKKKAFIAVDPGSKGAICLLVPESKQILFCNTSDKPINIIHILNQAQNEFNVICAMVEDVHSIHGTSAKSNFNFGYNTGFITGLIQASGLSLDRVTPKVWQKFIGVKSKGKLIKKEVAKICTDLYPNADIYGPKGGLLDGRSDALMIAHYTSIKHNI